MFEISQKRTFSKQFQSNGFEFLHADRHKRTLDTASGYILQLTERK